VKVVHAVLYAGRGEKNAETSAALSCFEVRRYMGLLEAPFFIGFLKDKNMRGLFGLIIVLGLVHLAIVEAVATNSVASCSASSREDAATCSCIKNAWRFGIAVEQSLIASRPVDADAAFRMCKAN
jgi:hypothetical protein